METELTKAASSNNRRELLIALRDKLAATIDSTDSGRDIAALSKRLMEVVGELDALPDPNAKKSSLRQMQEKVAKRNSD